MADEQTPPEADAVAPASSGSTEAAGPRLGSLHRGLVADRAVRFLAVQLAGVANQTRERHGLGPTAARVAAEALVAATLMSAWVKGRERITLQIQAERPRFAFMADVDAEGGIRARMTPAQVKLPEGGGLEGLLYAIRADVKREIYRGVSALDGQPLEEALARHVRGSEQMNAILRIGVTMREDGTVRSAAGMLLERLPEEPGLPSMDAATFAQTFDSIREQPAQDLLLALAFGSILGEKVELLDNRDLHWRCGCGQDRIEAVLFGLGAAELQALVDEQGQAEVSCHFCNVDYVVGKERLLQLIEVHASAPADAEPS